MRVGGVGGVGMRGSGERKRTNNVIQRRRQNYCSGLCMNSQMIDVGTLTRLPCLKVSYIFCNLFNFFLFVLILFLLYSYFIFILSLFYNYLK